MTILPAKPELRDDRQPNLGQTRIRVLLYKSTHLGIGYHIQTAMVTQ
jgi:hypothetical protein